MEQKNIPKHAILIQNTGVGKSIFVNYLDNLDLQVNEEDGEHFLTCINEHFPIPQINSKQEPSIVKFTDEGEFKLVDTPGLEDIQQDPNYRLKQFIRLSQILHACGEAVVVLVFSYEELNAQKGLQIDSLLNNIRKHLGNIDFLKESSIMIITNENSKATIIQTQEKTDQWNEKLEEKTVNQTLHDAQLQQQENNMKSDLTQDENQEQISNFVNDLLDNNRILTLKSANQINPSQSFEIKTIQLITQTLSTCDMSQFKVYIDETTLCSIQECIKQNQEILNKILKNIDSTIISVIEDTIQSQSNFRLIDCQLSYTKRFKNTKIQTILPLLREVEDIFRLSKDDINKIGDIIQDASIYNALEQINIKLILPELKIKHCVKSIKDQIKQAQSMLNQIVPRMDTQIRSAIENIILSPSTFDSIKQQLNYLSKFKNLDFSSLLSLLFELQEIFMLQLDDINELQKIINNASIFNALESINVKLELPRFEVSNLIQMLCQETIFEEVDNVLRISGSLVLFSDVQEYVSRRQLERNAIELPYIEVRSKYLIYADSNIVSHSSILSLGCKIFIIMKNIQINLSGLPGMSYPQQIQDHLKPGSNGFDGQPGRVGKNGGQLFLHGRFQIQCQGDYQISVDLSGGRGGDGQNGQDGSRGKDGEHGSYEDVDQRRWVETSTQITFSEKKLSEKFLHTAQRKLTFNDQFRETYVSHGSLPSKGGDGGKGGIKGFGGLVGKLLLEDNIDLNKYFTIVQLNNEDGQDGRAGEPGEGGLPGSTWQAIYINEKVCPTIQSLGKKLFTTTKMATTIATNTAITSATNVATTISANTDASTLGTSATTIVTNGITEGVMNNLKSPSLWTKCGKQILSFGTKTAIKGALSIGSCYLFSKWEQIPSKIILGEQINGIRQETLNENYRQVRIEQPHFNTEQIKNSYSQFLISNN